MTLTNKSLAVFLLSDVVRGVRCSYEPAPTGSTPVIKIFKTFDETIAVGDFVVVETETRHNMTVNKVEAVDVDVDLETDEPIRWIIGRVDVDQHKNILAQEQDALNKIASAEKRRKRDELKESLLADAGDVKMLAPSETLDGGKE